MSVKISGGVSNGFKNIKFKPGNTMLLYSYAASQGAFITSFGILNSNYKIAVGCGGTLRISFNLLSGNTAATVYANIFRNSIAVGTLRSTNSVTGITFTEDIAGWTAGDTLELKAYTNNSSYSVNVSSFTIKVEAIPVAHLV